MITVDLSHAPNPDIEGGYWTPPIDRGVLMRTCVRSLKHASNRCLAYIAKNHLGGGNWDGGLICRNGKPIGRVSYNGRVWAMCGHDITGVANKGVQA